MLLVRSQHTLRHFAAATRLSVGCQPVRRLAAPAKELKLEEVESFILQSTQSQDNGPPPSVSTSYFYSHLASFTVNVQSLLTGDTVKSIDLPPEVFGVPVRPDILHRVVVWKLACIRKGTGSV
jgi:hypothetical protein